MIDRLNNLFTTDFNLDFILAITQRREESTSVKYIDNPRKLCGLLMLTDYPATYYFENGLPLTANPGDVIFLPQGSCYKTEFHIPQGKVSHPILVNFRMTCADKDLISFPDHPIRLCKDDGRLLPIFTSIVQLYKSASTMMLKARVYELLGSIFPIFESDDLCLEYIHRHFTEEIYIPDLAKRAALSESEYRIRFKEKAGMSPMKYITKLKIDTALKMLMDDDVPIHEICDFLNFYSVPYFYKVFKEHTGLTPNQYREKALL